MYDYISENQTLTNQSYYCTIVPIVIDYDSIVLIRLGTLMCGRRRSGANGRLLELRHQLRQLLLA